LPRTPGANRLTLAATIAEREPLRFTPSGLPALSMTLHHASEQPEAGSKRRVECEIAAVAFGPVAQGLAKLPLQAAIRCEGFIARRYRTGITLALHIDRYESVQDPEHDTEEGN
jgi:primosomal replication protein N